LRLVPFAVWASALESRDDLYEAVRLYCGITHLHELVVECCYLYCYAIKQLIVNYCSSNEAYYKTFEESNRRARVYGFSTMRYWIENDIEPDGIEEEMPKPHYRPINYIKVSILWALYYLKHDYSFNDAIRDIISRGGDTQANAAIVGGLIGASRGINSIN
jgi:ADP-ribosyl-[dinitrogen reductase] hydrolase